MFKTETIDRGDRVVPRFLINLLDGNGEVVHTMTEVKESNLPFVEQTLINWAEYSAKREAS